MAPAAADQQQASQQHAARNAAIAALAARELSAGWPQIDWASPQAAAAVIALYGSIVTRYGQASAAVAAEFYDQLRAAALPATSSRFRATPADPVPAEQINRAVQSAFAGGTVTPAGAAPVPTSEATTSELPVEQRVPQRLESSLQRHVQQPARNTVAEAVASDPAKPVYVRVPQNDACAFCVLLASRSMTSKGRNQLYLSENSAKYVVGRGGKPRTDTGAKNPQPVGEKYHNDCRCEPMPVWAPEDIVNVSPKFGDYTEMYDKASADAGTSSDVRKILASMRKLHGLR
jgi:hypothetical protein